MSTHQFPAGFLWGAATSGHQTEGYNSGSDTWFAEQVRPSVFREPSGPACDSFRRWREDLDLAVAMGLTALRFSVEWARIEPEPGRYDAAALEHYGAIVDGCRAAGLAPLVTLNHFTCPHWFAMRGGWLDPEAPPRFAAYCAEVVGAIGAGIAYATTLNEPNMPRLLTHVPIPPNVRELERVTLEAASAAAGVPRYRLGNVVLPEELDAIEDGYAAAHRAARAAVRAVRPDLPVGLSIAVVDDVAHGDPGFRDRKRSEVYAPWLALAREDDYVGVQNYERVHHDGTGPLPPPQDAVRNAMGTAIDPASLGGAVRYAHAEAGVPVLVTEHGLAHDDDAHRAAFIEPALRSLRAAMDDGVPVLGYCHWILLDNFEWVSGYAMRLGLHEVDRTTFARTPKPSAGVLGAIARANALPTPP